jgi:hypothetical protein
MRLLPKIFPRNEQQAERAVRRELIRMEGKIGGEMFGAVEKGHHREFFCLDLHTWVWHESWTEKGQQKSMMIRYDVRPNAILKSQNGQSYQRLSSDEARNLYQAIELYQQRVGMEYQRLLRPTS